MVTKVDAAAEISNEEAAIVKEDVVEFSKEEAERETEAVDIFIVEETAGVTDAVLDISNEEAAKSTEALEETEMTDIYEASELATVEALVLTVGTRRSDEVKFNDFNGSTWTKEAFAMRVKFTVT